jgi:hypothetical protein
MNLSPMGAGVFDAVIGLQVKLRNPASIESSQARMES